MSLFFYLFSLLLIFLLLLLLLLSPSLSLRSCFLQSATFFSLEQMNKKKKNRLFFIVKNFLFCLQRIHIAYGLRRSLTEIIFIIWLVLCCVFMKMLIVYLKEDGTGICNGQKTLRDAPPYVSWCDQGLKRKFLNREEGALMHLRQVSEIIIFWKKVFEDVSRLRE